MMNSYLLFHSLAEMTSIAVAGCVFAITWNTRIYRPKGSSFFLLIGIASLFAGGIDLVHAMAYKGMNVFHGFDSNLPTQLWIASRYLQSLSILAASGLLFLQISKDMDLSASAQYCLLAGYAVITALLLFAIFARIFPDCFIEGSGLTPFKRISEYVICLILTAAAVLLRQSRGYIDREMLRSLMAAIVLSILTELAFTLYTDVYGLFNMLGHILKTIVFLALYNAIVHIGIKKPYTLLSRDLRDSEARYRTIVENSNDALFIQDFNGIISDVNENACKMLGYRRDELVGANLSTISKPNDDQYIPEQMTTLRNNDLLLFESEVILKDGALLPIELSAKVVSRDGDGIIQSFVRDITKRKQADEALRESDKALRALLAEKDVLLKEVHHRVKNNLAAIMGLIDLQGQKIVDEPTRAAMTELSNRIRSMSLVHEQLYQSKDLSRIDFQNYLDTLVSHLHLSYERFFNLHVSVVATGVEMSLDAAVPCGLLITELVTNAFKYAFPEGQPCIGTLRCEIAVTAEWDGATYTLTVADNGVGLPAGLDWTKTKTLGLLLVKMLGQNQLQGKIELDRTGGTTFRLRFVPKIARIYE
jgi:PAS domain S-box-containing protein